MSEIELLVDLYKGTERQGPGSKQDTLRALNMLNLNKEKNLVIADIGCGSGGQTLTLAENINGHIFAVDLFPEFLNELNNKITKLGFENKVTCIEKSMDNLPFNNNELDIIWSEGAIYNVGFENGIKTWKPFLKQGGYLCVSEITWLSNTRPKDIESYWDEQYAEINTASNKIKQLEENGYSPIGYFTLPVESWMDEFYKPLEEKFAPFLERHQYSKMAKDIVDLHKDEIKKYKANKDHYSYGFYLAQKI